MIIAFSVRAVLCGLQGVYRTFVQNAKFVNAASVPHIHFMASCVVEMFGLNMPASYEQAFTGEPHTRCPMCITRLSLHCAVIVNCFLY